jgi:hypothetical protein
MLFSWYFWGEGAEPGGEKTLTLGNHVLKPLTEPHIGRALAESAGNFVGEVVAAAK